MLKHAYEWLVVQAQRQKIRRQFRQHLGYEGNFENPRTYQEKVQFRKLYGNHAFYGMVSDKCRVREYVAAKAGAQYLIPLLGAYHRLTPEVFATLPERFIIKSNHGCKWHQVVQNKGTLNVAKTVKRFNTLCRRRYGWHAGERHYNFIKPKIVIEELLQGNTGGLPWDYSFFCYNTAKGFDYNFAICSPLGQAAQFTKDGQVMTSNIPPETLAPHLEPKNFDEMVRVARALSADFDFVRVDLYSIGDKVYFGELTCTPHQGYGAIADRKRQKMRDEMWVLDGNNPLLYNAPAAYRQTTSGTRRFGLRGAKQAEAL